MTRINGRWVSRAQTTVKRPRRGSLASVFRGLGAAMLGACLCGGGVQAQDSRTVSFAPGATGATITDTIRGQEYRDHVVNVREGQVMMVSLSVTSTNGDGSASFNIVPAGQDYPALYNGSMEVDSRAEVAVPESGDWAIRVYLMGNDRDADRTVGYAIDVSIPPVSGSASRGERMQRARFGTRGRGRRVRRPAWAGTGRRTDAPPRRLSTSSPAPADGIFKGKGET